MKRQNNYRGCLQIMRDQAWGFVFGFLSLIVALAGLILAIPQAAPIRSGIAQTFSSKATPALVSSPIPTTLPLTSAETLPENMVLKCNDCSDPIVVTITSVKVEPQNNRMVWTLSLFNNSQIGIACGFDHFTLQSPFDDNSFKPTFSFIPDPGPGETITASATFSFIPYAKVEYTLNAHMFAEGSYIQFLPIKITF